MDLPMSLHTTASLPTTDDPSSTSIETHRKTQCSPLACFPPPSTAASSPRSTTEYRFSDTKDTSALLLANVPRYQLNSSQWMQRHIHQMCPSLPHPSIIKHMDDFPSFAMVMFEKHFSSLIHRLKVSLSLINHNLLHLQLFITNEYHSFLSQSTAHELDYDELATALEYYLQMDADLFYMKTCSFRGAQPRSLDEGLFCRDQYPDVRYGLQPCQQIDCRLCQSSHIQFNPFQRHHFVNGYQSILNCPATCRTTNIIYVFTCPCGQYDFIGSTAANLVDVILYYRNQLTRYIHEQFTGCTSIRLSSSLASELTSVSDLLLYQHAIQCPSIIDLFLRFNANYRCFIPMLRQDAIEKQLFTQINAIMTPIRDPSASLTTTAEEKAKNLSKEDDARVDHCMKQIPVPMKHLIFTSAQRQQQRQFFRLLTKQFSPRTCDLYHISLLTVLPESSSSHLRTLIQTLFLLHAEPKLNR